MNNLLNSPRKNVNVLAEDELSKVVGGHRGYGRYHGGGKPHYGGGGNGGGMGKPGGGMGKPGGDNGMRRFGGRDVTIIINLTINQIVRDADA